MASPTRHFAENRRFRHLALAIVLSTGTVGGTVAFAMMTAPAFAQAGGGGGGGEGGNNGEDEGGHGIMGGGMGKGSMGKGGMDRGRSKLDGGGGNNEGERGKRGGRYGQGGPHPHPYPEEERTGPPPLDSCGGSRDTANTEKCRYTQPREKHRRTVSRKDDGALHLEYGAANFSQPQRQNRTPTASGSVRYGS